MFNDATPVTLTGTVGTSLSRTFPTSGFPAPAVTSGPLPGGLVLSAAGVLSGVPTVAGTFPVTLTATSSSGTATLQVNISIVPAPAAPAAPAFTDVSAVLLTGTVGTGLSRSFPTSGFPAPAVTVTSGVLPDGLAVSAAGVLSGTPTAAGAHTVTLSAANGVGSPASLQVSISIVPAPVAPAFADVSPVLLTGTVGTSLSRSFTTTGFPAPAVTVTSGVLPDGLAVSAAGVLSGTPTAAGAHTVTLSAANGVGSPASLQVSISIVPAPVAPAFADTAPVSLVGTVGTAVDRTFFTTGNPVPDVSVVAGELPDGLAVSAAGVLSGTPTAAGDYAFTLTASNGVGNPATLHVSITITPGMVTPELPETGSVGILNQIFGFAS
ncbi:putative Ig domain-containing protein [Rhodococcus sp. OK519]|uniref:putative Ig domain-containing protein n=1 Tax=Rhodococcus sp. OK519 TaxID=2135729 RepID=UPI003B96D5A2